MERTFVFGVGAQKAGTTWLHHYIVTDRKFRPGPLEAKEFHVWDIRDLPKALLPHLPFNWRNRKQFGMSVLRRSEYAYFKYFNYCLRNGGVAADITPSYAGLSKDRFRQISKTFAKSGVTAKFIFLMRDPLARCVSAFSMNRHKAAPGTVQEGVRTDIDLDSAFREYVTSDACEMRTNYASTLAALKQGCDEDQVKILFYEQLFTPEAIADLSQFIGIDCRPALAATKANTAKERFEISEKALEYCANHYRGTYEQVADAFPDAKELWAGRKYLA
ncbi:sulfotransferase domain-containing protein [Paracoccus sp. (in: a-proteobacteria)]|uniref:sulfotransferase domain-containing protein n=1 Tax=Paracoccus sp. TaxID=267 RepID=UPI003A8B0A8A